MCLNYLKSPPQLYMCSQIWLSFTDGIRCPNGSSYSHGYSPESNLEKISLTSAGLGPIVPFC